VKMFPSDLSIKLNEKTKTALSLHFWVLSLISEAKPSPYLLTSAAKVGGLHFWCYYSIAWMFLRDKVSEVFFCKTESMATTPHKEQLKEVVSISVLAISLLKTFQTNCPSLMRLDTRCEKRSNRRFVSEFLSPHSFIIYPASLLTSKFIVKPKLKYTFATD